MHYKSSCMQPILLQHERVLNTIYIVLAIVQMCGTHKFINSVQVDQVAKGNKHQVQNVKYVSIINPDVTELSVYQSSSCITSKTFPMHPPYRAKHVVCD